jgi:hypothetical protein
MNMNVGKYAASSGASGVSDLRGISLDRLPADLAAEALAARVTSVATEPAFTVSAFNSAM